VQSVASVEDYPEGVITEEKHKKSQADFRAKLIAGGQ